MPRSNKRPTTRLERRLSKELRLAISDMSKEYSRGLESGVKAGIESAKKEHVKDKEDLRDLRKAQYEMLRGLAQMVEAVSRAVIAFTTESAYK